MKTLLGVIFVLIASCAAPQVQQCPTCPKCPDVPESVSVTGAGKQTELTLSRDEFLSMYRLAKQYVALRDSVSNATIEKNVSVQKLDNDRYSVTIKLDDKMSMTTVVKVDNEELNRLRQQMHRVTTEKPSVNVERVSAVKFKITMWVDDVKFSTVIDIDDGGLDLVKYLKGFLAGVSFIGLLAKYKVIVFFLLL